MSKFLTPEQSDHFENMIYLPMVLAVLHKDRKLVDEVSFKFNRPYQELIDQAIKSAEKEYWDTRLYMKKHNLKLIKGQTFGDFTEYIFHYNGYEDRRKYWNSRLRNRTEELMGVYLYQGQSDNPFT